MSKRRFTEEFKESTVRQVLLEGTPVKQLAEKLGLHPSLIYIWKDKYLEKQEGHKVEPGANPRQMAAEIADLRNQLAKSQRINEILKKTVGYFSKDD
jgi:transposase